MLKFILLAFLVSCSSSRQKGGQNPYLYDGAASYSSSELQALSKNVVVTSQRDPHVGKLKDLFGKGQNALRRVGIIIFETEIQPTRSGLSYADKIYLSAQGKQILTENFLKIWEESFTTFEPDIAYVTNAQVAESKAIHNFGLDVDDHINSDRVVLDPDNIFYLETGKKTTTSTVLNPRNMQDLSFVLVPATEMMMGPKWSEHNKQYVNEMMKELNLDAALIIMSEVSWTSNHIDKHSGEPIPEAVKFGIRASTLVSLSDYRARAEKLKLKDPPSVNLCYRAYEAKFSLPISISVPTEQENFHTIEEQLLRPMFKTYADLSLMLVHQIANDLRKTW